MAIISEDNVEGGGFEPFTGHTDGIRAIAYSPDGNFVATASYDTTIRIWDVTSGRQAGGTMRGHTKRVNGISYAPDGRSLVSCSHDGTVRVWDLTDTGNAPSQILEHAEGQTWMTVSFSPDGQLIAGGHKGGKLKIWDAGEQTLESEYEAHSGIWSAAWEPSRKRIATGCSDGKVRIFDLTRPGTAALLIEGHRRAINSVTYSPDGKLLASGADDRSVRLWDARTGDPVMSPFRGHKHYVASLAWSPDSTRIVSGSVDGTVHVWDASRGQILFKGPLCAHNGEIWSLSHSPDGKAFVSADGHSPHRIQIWDARTGKLSLPLLPDEEQSTLKHLAEERYADGTRSNEPVKMKAGAAVSAVVWFPDGQHLATAGEEPLVRIWSAYTGLQVGEMVGHHEAVNALSVSADGTKLATASDDHTILLFDTGSMQSLRGPLTGSDGAVYAVKLMPDGSKIISGGKDTMVRVWDAVTGAVEHVIDAHTDAVRALSVTKHGKNLASGGDDNSIYVWDMETYQRLAGPFKHGGSTRTLSWSPDGLRLMSGSDDFTVRVWNVATGNPAFDPIRVHTGPIGAVDWSPDGKKLLTAGAHDWTIWIWDASKGERLLGPLEDHEDGIRAAAFSPDGKRFISGSMDHTLRTWNTATGLLQTHEETESLSAQAEPSQRDGVRRRHSIDDSIMNMPATIGGRKSASKSQTFWDGADLDGPSGRQRKSATTKKNNDNVRESQHQTNFLSRIWRRRTIPPISKLKGKDKEQGTEINDLDGRAGTRMPRLRAMRITAARAKLRIKAAADRSGTRPDPRVELDPETDDDSDSPDEVANPSQDHLGGVDGGDPPVEASNPKQDHSDGDDDSEDGFMDTLIYCLCIPLCK